MSKKMATLKYIKTVFFLSLLFFCTHGIADNCSNPKDYEKISSQFHTIVLQPLDTLVDKNHPQQGVILEKLFIPGSRKKQKYFTNTISSRFLNRDLSMNDIEELRCFILLYYKEHGTDLIEVIIPPQDITEGTLTVIVSESRLGQISVTGNVWSSPHLVENSLGLKSGEKINSNDLLVDLSYLNRNPFRRTDVIFSPGEKKGTTDLEFVTQEKRAYRVYAGIDNRGNDAIGTYRQYEGFSCGDFLGIDHLFSYQLTTSIPLSRMYAHAAYYEIPLPKKMALAFYGGFSKVRTKRFSKEFRNSGENVQFSSRYHFPLFSWLKGSNDYSVGFDYKRSNNNVLFSEDPVIAKMATLTQLVLTYTYDNLFQNGWGTFVFEFYLSPIRWLSHQTKSDYQLLSPKAIPQYYYFTLNWEKTFHLPASMDLFLRFQGQYANQNLLPSEQLGLGGYDTVRGYQEREINGDQGVLANLELLFPYFSLLKRKVVQESSAACQCSLSPKDALRFLAFFDYGFTQNHHSVKGETNSQYILGIGPGLRYVIDPYLNLTLYWGFRLKATDISGTGGRLNFNFVASF